MSRREKRWEDMRVLLLSSFAPRTNTLSRSERQHSVRGLIIDRIASTNLAELRAGNDRLDRAGHFVVVGLQFAAHLRQQAFIAELHRAPQGKSEQFAVELPQERLAAGRQQVLLQA